MNATMERVTFTVRTDRSTKNAFGELCGRIGISVSSAINAFIRQAVRQQSISFSALDENGFSPAEALELKRRAEEVRLGKVQRHALIEA